MIDILITGPSKSGKSSVKNIVFNKMSPQETLFIEPTERLEPFEVKTLSYCRLDKILEIPSNFSIEKIDTNNEHLFSKVGLLIYVIDTQISTSNSEAFFKENIIPILKKYKNINDVIIFIHKTDYYMLGSADFESKKNEIHSKFSELLLLAKKETGNQNLSFNYYNTSIYDTSLFESFSSILKKFIPQNKNIEELLNKLNENTKIEKSYLFDVLNKIYLGIDSTKHEAGTYEICSDLIDILLDMNSLYENKDSDNDSFFDDQSTCIIKIGDNDNEKQNDNDSDAEENLDKGKKVLYLKFIDLNLALIAIMDEINFDRTHLIEYNIKLFGEAVKKILLLH